MLHRFAKIFRPGFGTRGTAPLTVPGKCIERLETAAAVQADKQVLFDISHVRAAKQLERIPLEQVVLDVIRV